MFYIKNVDVEFQFFKIREIAYCNQKIKFLKFHILKFIYSQQNQQHFDMILALGKFIYKTQNLLLNHVKTVQVQITYELQTYNLKINLYNQTPFITLSDQSSAYLFNKQCKMLPIFSQSSKQSLVTQIHLYDQSKTFFCILICKNLSETDTLYQKLKRTISHKGFGQFYKPLKRLGRGTFATVYLIQHKYTKVRKAAKVFSYEGQKIQFKGKEALQNQIKTLRQIDHPNLIKYDGLYETDNLIYLVTEYLSGGTLEDMMKNKCVHTGEFVSKIIKDCLQGLKYLDEMHIMHRDIKPQNIIYRKQDDTWVLSDFGLAAKSNEQYIYDKCGTMGYIAPQIMEMSEQNPKKYSQQCDIYSLGVIAYTLIIGSLPFRVQSQNFFDKKIVWDLFERPQCNQLNPQILKFLRKMLMKSPKQRYTAKEALESSFFTDKQAVQGLYQYHERRRQQRYDKILKIANIQY